jgi:MFS transporter, SP family, galactose:H+ symporter
MNKNLLIYAIAAVAATGGLLFGYDTGVINVALPSLKVKFHLENSPDVVGWDCERGVGGWHGGAVY